MHVFMFIWVNMHVCIHTYTDEYICLHVVTAEAPMYDRRDEHL
jgi:hypothetical protein